MAPAKKQRTSKNSSVATKKRGADDSENKHKKASKNEPKDEKPKLRNTKKIPRYEYICFYRPQFDLEASNRVPATKSLTFKEVRTKFAKENAPGKNVTGLDPAADHPGWKWVIMWEGWKAFCEYKRRARYCNPDLFRMVLYSDWEGWGLQELMENWMLDFDAAFNIGDDEASRLQMWSVISGLNLWFNAGEVDFLYNTDDPDKTKELFELFGYALLTALAALDKAGELKPDSAFLDIGIVITGYLEFTYDIADYGVAGKAIAWRHHAATYFQKAGLETSSGLGITANLLEEFQIGKAEIKEGGKDPWGWENVLKKYKKRRGTPKIGGTHYDITKMTRKERAAAAFDRKDPLQKFSLKDLKENTVGFGPPE